MTVWPEFLFELKTQSTKNKYFSFLIVQIYGNFYINCKNIVKFDYVKCQL